jgi:hypothetical protein
MREGVIDYRNRKIGITGQVGNVISEKKLGGASARDGLADCVGQHRHW